MKKITTGFYVLIFICLIFAFNCSASMTSYETYFQNNEKAYPKTAAPVDINTVESLNGTSVIDENADGAGKAAVITGDDDTVTFTFNVPETGFYNLEVGYLPIEGKGSTIERKILIDGAIPFIESGNISFTRVWKDVGEISKDPNGDDIRAGQKEDVVWRTVRVSDTVGYYNEPLCYYLEKGEHTLGFESVKETMAIGSVSFVPVDKLITYADYLGLHANDADGKDEIKIQAEHPIYKSQMTIYPLYDRSSTKMEPYDTYNILLSSIGRDKWQTNGDWIEWEIDVPADGMYKISTRFNQSKLSGMYTSRKLFIDDEIPFAEASSLMFNFSGEWQVRGLGSNDLSGNFEEYKFYLTKGKHVLRLEVTMGEMADILRKVDDVILELNAIYRRIIMVTGAAPDTFRDYYLEKKMPDVIEKMKVQNENLKEILDLMVLKSGGLGEQTAVFTKLIFDLEGMYNEPRTIPARLVNFKTNLGTMSAWILEIRKQPLELDYILVAPPEATLPKAEGNFIDKTVHEVSLFISSFTRDYNTVINTESGEKYRSVEIWIGSGALGGRDQAQILRQMLDDSFTPKYHISGDLQLVAAGTLLPATLAGNGPDVVLQIPIMDPVNYATRSAVVDLRQFDDFNEIEKRFNPAAIQPYQVLGGTFALPETFTYPMMFYRSDILEELGIEIPQTWEDLYAIVPELQKRNMNVGIPNKAIDAQQFNSFNIFSMFVFQNGGKLYSEKGDKILLSDIESLESFRTMLTLYQNYKLPVDYDPANRFRTGEFPLLIEDFTLLNQLSVFAPEIKGLWGMVPVPGVRKEDGTIDRSVAGAGVGCMMMESVKDKEAAWEFMKWWTDKDTQIRFSRELEGVMGTAARYAAANVDAIEGIPWTSRDYDNLMLQWNHVKAIPQVPGSYISPRTFDFAFRAVLTDNLDIGETIIECSEQINEELARKREELGID